MQRRGAATPKIVIYFVFAVLIATIVTFITIGYFTYNNDMKLSTVPVTISMHDSAALQPNFYQVKDTGDPEEKGEITKMVRTVEPTMSLTEKAVWIIGGIALLGVLAGIIMAFMKLWYIGRFIAGGCAITVVALGCGGWYLNTHRETPYDITLQPELKNGAIASPVTFTANDSTTIKIAGNDVTVLSLKTGMKVVATLTQEGDAATKIISPIPDKGPKKGEITAVAPSMTAKAGMSQGEELMWGIAGVGCLGIVIGIVAIFRTKKKAVGLSIAVIGGIVLAVCVWQALYMTNHRTPPYDVVIKVDMKGDQKAELLTVTVNDQTTVNIDEKGGNASSLKPGMKVAVLLGEDKKTAVSVESPIPNKGPRNGEIISLAQSTTLKAEVTFTEKIVWGIAVVAGLVVILGLMMVFKKQFRAGLSIAVIGGIACGICVWRVQYLAANRTSPYDIMFKPEAKGDQKLAPITLLTNSSTTVKINGEEKDVKSLQPGMKVSATLSDDNKTVNSIVSPIPEKLKTTLRLPAGFHGSAKREEPKYLNSDELKNQYLVQCFTVEKGAEIFQVAQVDREPLGFTAFARSLRLGALHDFKNSKLVEEGPTIINGAETYASIVEKEKDVLSLSGVDAYALTVEGDDDNGVHVKSRQIAIQGEGTTMYVIKGTAPATEWPAAGEVFDAAIASFEVSAPSPASAPPETPAESQPATQTAR